MRIKTYGTEYLIYLRRGDDTQTVEIVEATGDKEVKNLIYNTFRGRTQEPKSGNAPFTKILVKRLNTIKKESEVVIKTRCYNYSPRQARIELENAIRMSQ